MGGGAWTTATACNYINTTYGVSDFDALRSFSTTQIYTAPALAKELNPQNVIRECRDSEEHPETFPIILALDVTGSMGTAATNCAAKLNDIMTSLYGKVKDVEFMMMGIGDLNYDDAPIQATQFESDVRILDQTTKIYFEGGGGGNTYESYTAAWYFGLYHTDLDCWKRGKKGLIITMGDEPLNPYLPGRQLYNVLDGTRQSKLEDVDTETLYSEVTKKFHIYHIAIMDQESSFLRYKNQIAETWGKLLNQNLIYADSEKLPEIISQIVDDVCKNDKSAPFSTNGGISW